MATYELYDGNGNIIESRSVQLSNEEINAPILVKLSVIDLKSIRALREGDQVRIDDLEEQAAALRAQLV
jgi:cold shock CspA family protein